MIPLDKSRNSIAFKQMNIGAYKSRYQYNIFCNGQKIGEISFIKEESKEEHIHNRFSKNIGISSWESLWIPGH